MKSERDLEAELAEQKGKAEAFTHLSHEIRTLLRGVIEITGLLLDTDLSLEQRDYAKRIRTSGGALLALVNDILDLSKLTANKLALERVDFDLERTLETAGGPPAPPERRPRVLLVEDNAVNQRVALLLVGKRGYDVDVAPGGLEAIEATARVRYDAVLMDCNMPRLDGFSATAQIRAREGSALRTPIIAMTASAGPGARQQCLAAGMDDYLEKPIVAEELDRVLARWAPKPRGATLDRSSLDKLRALRPSGKPDLAVEIIEIFLADAPARLTSLREAVDRGDLEAMMRAAHTLKGGAGHVGAKLLETLCARLEVKARSGAPFDAAFAVTSIEEEFGRARAALLEELGRAARGEG